jgi:hypothetical protein
MKKRLVLAAVPALFFFAHTGAAEPPLSCRDELDPRQLLRRLSLDLRGTIPSVGEYSAAPDDAIDGFLATPQFAAQMRRYHDALFWPNVSNVRLGNINSALRNGTSAYQINSAGRARIYRGALDTECGDFQQTAFDPAFPGEFRPVVTPDANGVKREGWRMVTPYWDRSITVKVCAFDAQETVRVGNLACNTPEGGNNPACGCGPNLRHCYGPGVANAILASLREQLSRSVDDVTTGGRPYTDLVTSTKAWTDGRIAFWKRYLAPNVALNLTYNVADPEETIPNKDWADTTWVEVDRKGLHAGVVTLPAYLLRFQTDRGRANRFRIDFMGEYFVPPAKMEPTPGCSADSADLTQRCNCQYCHSRLEPMAAHFGLFAEAGTTLMTDETRFKKNDPSCIGRDNGFCGRFYVTNREAHRAGWLLPLQFADTHAEYGPAIEGGPRKLAEQIIADGTFARTAVKKVFLHLAKRDMRVAGETTNELALLERLATGFAQSRYSLSWLVKEIVRLPQYRRFR